MYRRNATSNSRTAAGALSALAVAIGAVLFSAAPAKADGFGFFFAPPVPFPIPAIVVEHHDDYRYGPPPAVVYERPVYRPYPVYYGHRPHRHHAGCHHRGDRDWRRGDWDDHRDRHYRRDVDYRRY
jgi:hypothetical protein